jgi:3-oxoacid CoA-transferase subunit A
VLASPTAAPEGIIVIDKLRADVMSTLEAVPSGATLAVGGFGSSGRPDTLLDTLCDLDRRDFHLIVNNVGDDFTGVGRMLAEGRIRRLTASFPVLPEFYDEYFAGQVELELIPQGTLAERLRAGGSGIAAFFTPSGAGTMLADGTFPLRYTTDRATGDPVMAECMPVRETREFDGREHVLEYGIVADFALVKAFQGDRRGNLRFHLSARNFNPLAAMAGRRTFAEIQHLVEVDELHPDDIHLPGVFVDDVLLASDSSPKKPTIAGFS